MSEFSIERPADEKWDESREQRLLEIRREAEAKSQVNARGIRLPGAPLPTASVETGYYGTPLLKQPAWTWDIR